MTTEAEGKEEGEVGFKLEGRDVEIVGAAEALAFGGVVAPPVAAVVAPLVAVAGVAGARLSTALAGKTISAHTMRTIGSSQSALRPGGDGDIADADEVS